MIVEPDFLDHWKTRLLARLLGTELAPIYVLRLWAHCQQRKTDRFTGWNPDVLASVCRWDGDGKTLWAAMLQTYIEQDGEHVVARGWSECNAGLVSAWENGKKGGRPAKPKVPEPTGNRPVIPVETGGQTDRVDRIDITPPIAPQGGQPATPCAPPPSAPDPADTQPKPRRKAKAPVEPAPGFALFWAAYPAKLAKTAAMRAWNAIAPDAALADRIVADVQARRNSHDWTKDMGQFIPHPSTYLNQRRWEDMRETLALVAAPGDRKPVGQMTEREILEWATR